MSDDGGQTREMPDASPLDDGHTKAIPEAETSEADGQTVTAPEADTGADGETLAFPETPDETGETRAMPDPAASVVDRSAGFRPKKVDPSAVTITAPLENRELETGQILNGRYRLEKILGKGGFGAAYLAQDETLKRWCVVKQMLLPRAGSAQKLERYQANFAQEANLLAQLNHPGHPNIPEIYDYFSDDKGNYLVMKYIEGSSLARMIDQTDEPLPWRQVIGYGVDLCSALEYMHTHGDEPVIHRDIKPANIVVDVNDRVWLLDFGLAKAQPVEDSAEAHVTKAFGSLGYSPLEQWLGQATPASDIYALGSTLHYLLTGLNPAGPFGDQFNIQKLQQLHGQFIPIRKVNRNLPDALEGIIASTTSADPAQRPSAQQLLQQLRVFISGAKDTPLFTFKSGESATTKGRLVDLCDRHRHEAIGYLYGGDFERWFRLTNRNDLAEAAAQGIEVGKSQKEGLDKFLRLVLPNLFWRRLGRAAMHVGRATVQFILSAIIIILVLAVTASFIARLVIWQVLGNTDWNFYEFEIDQENSYTELELNQLAQSFSEVVLDNVLIDIHPGDHLDISATWGGIFLFELPLTVDLEADRPHFRLANINGIELGPITDLIYNNISQGLNAGTDTAFRDAPVKITSLDIEEDTVRFRVGRREDVAWDPPVASTPTTPTATPGPASAKTTLLAVSNELDQDIMLRIDDKLWRIGSNAKEIIKLESGTYRYDVRTIDGKLGDQGERDWTLSAYELHIGVNQVTTFEAN